MISNRFHGVTSKFNVELVDETLPYADNVLPAEVILVFILAGIEALRLFFGKYKLKQIIKNYGYISHNESISSVFFFIFHCHILSLHWCKRIKFRKDWFV